MTGLDHKAFLAELGPKRRAALTAKSDAAGLTRFAVLAAAMTALAVLVAMRVPLWPLLLPVLGVLLAFTFTLEHECTHKTPFATPWLNEAAGYVSGFLIVQPFVWFRYFHLAHHRDTNDPARDPELVGKPKPVTFGQFLDYASSLKYWRGKLRLLLANAFGEIADGYLPRKVHPQLRREARIMLALYVAAVLFTAFVSPVLLWIWLVPLLLGFPVLRIYLLAEHGGCPAVANMFGNTRTTYTNAVVRFITWNMPYHAEHHAFPSVPAHKLPELHRLARPHLLQTDPGYVAFTAGYLRGLSAAAPAGEQAQT